MSSSLSPAKIFAADSGEAKESHPAATVIERKLAAEYTDETLRVKGENLPPLTDLRGSDGAFGT